MMLMRFRSRAVPSSNKQGLMADHSSQSSSPTHHPHKTQSTGPISSFLGSPRFRHFMTKGYNTYKIEQPEPVMSPTSILDVKPLIGSKNPFWYYKFQPKTTFLDQSFQDTKQHCSWENLDNKGIGLAFIDHINLEENENEYGYEDSLISKNNKPLLFGSKLKVQIPSFSHHSSPSPTESPGSPGDFEMKMKGFSHLSGTEPSKAKYSTQILSVSEMELSEDYTCVITHGPNPTTTHIFDDCIIQSYCSPPNNPIHHEPYNFLSSCWTCKKCLDQNKDIYIYRGEKAFCSSECRFQEMLLDGEAIEEADDPSGTSF